MKRELTDIIIDTDASYDSKTRYGAWAYIIEIDGVKQTDSGTVALIPNSSVIELVAIIKALNVVIKQVEDVKARRFQVFTDSKWAIAALQGTFKGSTHQDLVDAALNVVEGLEIAYTKVKAHTNDQSDVRLKANHWCDAMAKAAMKRADFNNAETTAKLLGMSSEA